MATSANILPRHGMVTAAWTIWRERTVDTLAVGAALCAAPLSIAVSESFLAMALVGRIGSMALRQTGFIVPRVFWFWLLWAGLEIVAWLHSPQPAAGTGEIRHLLLIASLFAVLPALRCARFLCQVWQGIFLTATVGSLALIVSFIAKMLRYRYELSTGGDPGFYLRTGGLLHHWMIYATVEIVVFAALLEYRVVYPEMRRWTTPLLAINCLAILLSLTRCLWLASLVVLALHLVWRRSPWAWVLPLIPVLALWIAPGPLRSRMEVSFQPDYYSNAERVQMWRVGWKMMREQPLLGAGPGRIEALYTGYLSPGEPVPAFHGHLHNNAIQVAAQFGLPALGAAILCLAVLVVELLRRQRRAEDRDRRFASRAGLLGLAGFLSVGMLDYTYGHSLGLILLTFAVVSPLICDSNALPKPVGASGA